MPGGGYLKKFYSYIVFVLFCVSFAYSNDLGCTNENACNFNPNAIEDDGSCLYFDCLSECGGQNYDCCDDPNSQDYSNCPIDCTGCLGGNAFLDDCGNCVGGTTTNELQECGSTPCIENWAMDCSGECYGNALEDECGVCDNDSTNDCAEDCLGIWGGNSELDDCGICNGGNVIGDVVEPCEGPVLDPLGVGTTGT